MEICLIRVHTTTIWRWINWYQNGGLQELFLHRLGAKGKTRLSPELQQELLQEAKMGKIKTIWDGVRWAEERGVNYTYWGMRHLFRRIGLRKKTPRPSSPKASPKEQARWKKGVWCAP